MDNIQKIRAIEYFEKGIIESEKYLSQIPTFVGTGTVLLILALISWIFVLPEGWTDSEDVVLSGLITVGMAVVGGFALVGGTATFLFVDLKGKIEKNQSHIKQIEREIDEAKVLMKKGGVDNLKQSIKTFERYLSHEETPHKIPLGAFYILAPGSSYKSNNEEGLGALFGD